MLRQVCFYSTFLRQKQAAHEAQVAACKLLEKRLPSQRDQLHGMILDQFSNSLAALQQEILRAPTHLQPKLQLQVKRMVKDLGPAAALQVAENFEAFSLRPDPSDALTMNLSQQRALIQLLPPDDQEELLEQLKSDCYASIQRINLILDSLGKF